MGVGLAVYYYYSRHHVLPYAERLDKLLRSGHGTTVEERSGGESPPPATVGNTTSGVRNGTAPLIENAQEEWDATSISPMREGAR